jgi:hypothetical protein
MRADLRGSILPGKDMGSNSVDPIAGSSLSGVQTSESSEQNRAEQVLGLHGQLGRIDRCGVEENTVACPTHFGVCLFVCLCVRSVAGGDVAGGLAKPAFTSYTCVHTGHGFLKNKLYVLVCLYRPLLSSIFLHPHVMLPPVPFVRQISSPPPTFPFDKQSMFPPSSSLSRDTLV